MKGVVVIAQCVAIALATTAAPGRAQSSSSSISKSERFSNETATKQHELVMNDSMSVSRLKLRAGIESGELSFRLVDPRGVTRLDGRRESGNVVADTGDLEPVPGTWELELELENATGQYELDWSAR